MEHGFRGGSVKEGSLQLNTSESAKNSCYTYLTATTQDPNPPFKTADLTKSWTDYTVEMDFKRTGAPQSSTGVFLIGRNNGTSHYSMQSNGNKIALRRLDEGKYTLLTSADFPTDTEQWYHIKMEFKGNTIICSAANADGTEKASFTFTDNSALAPKNGSVGMHVSKLADWCPQFDNFKVTAADSSLLFFDDFTDSRYLDGVTTKWDAFSYEYVMNYKWNEQYSAATSSTVSNGKYVVSVGRTGTEKLFLNGSIFNSAAPDERLDIADAWSDYTVEFDYNADYSDELAVHPGVFVHGRARYDAEHNGYSSYAVKLHPKVGVYIFKYYYDTAQNKWTSCNQIFNAKAFRDYFADGAMLHAKVSFEDVANGVKISVTLTDADGNIIKGINDLSWIDTGENGAILRNGGVYLSMDRNGDDATPDTWTATFDNFKVFVNDAAVFEDTFADERYFLGATNEEEVEVQYAWDEEYMSKTSSAINDGKYVVSVGKASGDKVFLTGKFSDPAAPDEMLDIADAWSDYTVEFDYNANYSDELTTHPGVFVHGRAQYDAEHNGYSSYAVKLHPTVGIYIFKYYYDTAQNKWTSTNKSYGAKAFRDYFENGAMLHAKISFEDVADGVKISATLTDADGNIIKGIDGLSWTDTGVDFGPVLRNGGVYLSMDRNGDVSTADTWTATFDDFKVTMDNKVVFEDTFTLAENQTSAEYLAAGKTGSMVKPTQSAAGGAEEDQEEWQFAWNEEFASGTTSAISNGQYVVTAGNKTGSNKVFLTGVNAEGADFTGDWSNYTVEFDYNADYPDDVSSHPGVFVYGRAQYNAENGKYSSYAFKLHPGVGPYYFKYIDETAASYNRLNTGTGYKSAFANGAMVHVKAAFETVAEGVKISVTLTDAEGNVVGNVNKLSWTDKSAELLSKGGFYLSIDKNQTVTFDNFKVTVDNEVVFEDTFTLADNQPPRSI